jgi:hypothetical protein
MKYSRHRIRRQGTNAGIKYEDIGISVIMGQALNLKRLG